MSFNVVELMQDEDADCAFDQRCRYGHRVDGHAVYCHNDLWRDKPRKCQRSWATACQIRDEDCAGFEPNSASVAAIGAPPSGRECAVCWGARLLVDNGLRKTCPHCDGLGVEPADEVDEADGQLLELAWDHDSEEWKVRALNIQKAFELEARGLWKLGGMLTYGSEFIAMVRLTGRGRAALLRYWDRPLT